MYHHQMFIYLCFDFTPLVSTSNKIYQNCSVLVQSWNRFVSDLRTRIVSVTIKPKPYYALF